MRGNKLHVDQTKKDRERPAVLAKGGKDRMFGEQAANPAKSGTTGKPNVSGPGARAAKGGSLKTNPGGLSRPARPGSTGPG
jgi:hypothetical protein